MDKEDLHWWDLQRWCSPGKVGRQWNRHWQAPVHVRWLLGRRQPEYIAPAWLAQPQVAPLAASGTIAAALWQERLLGVPGETVPFCGLRSGTWSGAMARQHWLPVHSRHLFTVGWLTLRTPTLARACSSGILSVTNPSSFFPLRCSTTFEDGTINLSATIQCRIAGNGPNARVPFRFPGLPTRQP